MLAMVITVGLLLVACDTGDGKQLKDYDPADYPSQTEPPPSVVGSGVDEFEPVDEAPADSVASQSFIEGASFQLFAPWLAGGAIDVRNTCDGENVAPALSWGAVPVGTAEIAIALVDDSAVSNGEPFVHWVIGGLDPEVIALVEGDVPEGAVQALNYSGDVGYSGPCPPEGDDAHVYRLTAYALDSPLQLADGALANEFLDAIATATLASTDLSGTYQR